MRVKLKFVPKWILMQLSAFTLILCFSQSVFASISAFSRAHCLGFVNESITWEASGVFGNNVLYVQSYHVPISSSSAGGAFPHFLSDGGSNWRARAGDQGDTFGTLSCPRISSWNVYGWHSYYDPDRSATIDLGSSSASDCNLSEW
jgi:hypothetical protein